MSTNSPTVRVARWSATHPWRAIGLWIALVTAAVALMLSVPTQQVSEADAGSASRAKLPTCSTRPA